MDKKNILIALVVFVLIYIVWKKMAKSKEVAKADGAQKMVKLESAQVQKPVAGEAKSANPGKPNVPKLVEISGAKPGNTGIKPPDVIFTPPAPKLPVSGISPKTLEIVTKRNPEVLPIILENVVSNGGKVVTGTPGLNFGAPNKVVALA